MVRRKKKAAAKQMLSGVWNGDGGRYYIRQVGNTVWWAGLNNGTGNVYTNVFRGRLNRQSGLVTGNWSDVPRGVNNGNGRLVLRVVSNQRLRKVSSTGGFGANIWNYEKPQGL